jgi:hypothetical protein
MATIIDSVVQLGTAMMPLGRLAACSGFGGDRGPLRGHLVGHVEHGQVHAVEHAGLQRDDLDILAAHPQPPAGRAGRGDQPDLAPDVGPGGQQVEHHGADGPGRADHGQGRPALVAGAHRPLPP